MSEEPKNFNIEKIVNGVISYLEFEKKLKIAKPDNIIPNKPNNKSNLNFAFRDFNLECYIIEEKYLTQFKKAINFDKLSSLLEAKNENKNKFKEELEKYLQTNSYALNTEDIKIYSKEDDMKKIIPNFNDYIFVNEELLVNAMGVPKNKLEGNLIKISNNEKNISLISTSNNFTLNFNNKKYRLQNQNQNENQNQNQDKNKEIEEYKNIYYVEEITKKIFILMYFNEQLIQKKIKKEIKDIYNFKDYYLINREWIEKYKAFFLYDYIIDKLKDKLNLENNENNKYSYNKVKYNLDDIAKNKLSQIRLYSETKLDNNIRDGKELIPEMSTITIKKQNEDYNYILEIPSNFELINDDIFQLLKQEQFFYNLEGIENEIKFRTLIGKNQLIIKNKKNREGTNNYIFYIDKNLKSNNIHKNNLEKENSFIINYILHYENDKLFLKNLEKIIKKDGLHNFILNKDLDINKFNSEQSINDDDVRNIVGTFINLGLDEEVINNIEKNQISIQKEDSNIIKNKFKISNENFNFVKKEKPRSLGKNKNNKEINKKIKISKNNQNNQNHNNNLKQEEIKNVLKNYQKDINNKQKIIDLLKEIDLKIKKNRNEISKNKIIENEITKYYLINSLWVEKKLKKENKKYKENEIFDIDIGTIEPTIINHVISEISYPIDFDIIKYKNNEYIYNNLVKYDKNIEEDFYISEIFFVNDNNIKSNKNINKSLYIGIIDNNKKNDKKKKIYAIYFYLFKNNKFSIEFILNYDDGETMINEINNNIMPKGIEAYLYEMNFDFENMNENENILLFNNDLNQIGTCFIITKRANKNIEVPEYSKGLQNINNSYYFNPILVCLANILIIKKIFTNNKYLYKNKIIEDTSILKQFYKIVRNMWFWNDLQKEDKIYIEFYEQIVGLYGSNDIFKNSKQLIEFLIINMHNEIRTYNDKKKVKEEEYIKLEEIYLDKNHLIEQFYSKNNSIFQKLFFFETRLTEQCKCGNYYQPIYEMNCILYFKMSEKVINNNSYIKLSDFFETLKEVNKCDACNQNNSQKVKKFNSCPQYLIIVIESNKEYNNYFIYEKDLDISKYKTSNNKDSYEYHLISFVKRSPIDDNNDGIIFCKSPVNEEWYKYEGTKVEKKDINEENNIPYIIIYQNKCVRNIKIEDY